MVTYLPFLWRPDAHMFLKPDVTLAFARAVGHGFQHDYAPDLDIAVYRSLLDLVEATRSGLAALAPRDNIDLQSLIWVVGGYTAKDVPAAERAGQG